MGVKLPIFKSFHPVTKSLVAHAQIAGDLANGGSPANAGIDAFYIKKPGRRMFLPSWAVPPSKSSETLPSTPNMSQNNEEVKGSPANAGKDPKGSMWMRSLEKNCVCVCPA